MQWKNPFRRDSDAPKEGSSLALRAGGYSLVMTALVLVIAVAVNLIAGMLPSTMTRYDISAAKLYSVTSNTKSVLSGLTDDVTVYWIVQSGAEDRVVENLLANYEALSDHIKVEKRNPDVYPTFAEQYTDETVQNNSLVVECGDRSRYIAYNEIYPTDLDIYSYAYTTSFDGEGALTSAINYVTTEDVPKIYLLEGHGESELPSTFQSQIERENYETAALSLLTVDAIPEDADCILIYGPQSDLADEEVTLLQDYLNAGGKVLVFSGPAVDTPLENLETLLTSHGVEPVDGLVVEGDRERYAFQLPYALLPEMAADDITDPLTEEGYTPVFSIAQGLDTSSASSGVTTLLSSSEVSFSKADGYDITTYEKEDGDTDGPFALAVSVITENDGELIWFGSSAFLDDSYNAVSSGANVNLTMNALTSLVGETGSMSIRAKSLNYNYLTISDSTSSLLKTLMIGVFPLCYLGLGVVVVLRRRRLQNESH